MKKVIKKFFIIVMMILLTMLMLIGESKAALQANLNTHYKKSDVLTNWMVNIRNMEKSGEAMGLSETLNSDLTSVESNNIDVHLMRSTEYGAIAILSASGYGNPQTLQQSSIKTTTGNKTGIYFSGINWESTASVCQNSIAREDSRYHDNYTVYITSAKVGDALGNTTTSNPGCANWHSASDAKWVEYNSGSSHFKRGGSGIFSFKNDYSTSNYFARGVAVCGTGL